MIKFMGVKGFVIRDNTLNIKWHLTGEDNGLYTFRGIVNGEMSKLVVPEDLLERIIYKGYYTELLDGELRVA